MHWAISSVFHEHLRSIWTPDPVFNYTDSVALQTRRFCSGYITAYLTFSTTSLPRKLCNCYTYFLSKKRSLPKKKEIKWSNGLSPNKTSDNGQIAYRGISVLSPQPPQPLWDSASNRYGGSITEMCLRPDEMAALPSSTQIPNIQVSPFVLPIYTLV